ncbi:MAG: hypothetical protein ACM31H_00410 [Nitrososphaerales archaeon]
MSIIDENKDIVDEYVEIDQDEDLFFDDNDDDVVDYDETVEE